MTKIVLLGAAAAVIAAAAGYMSYESAEEGAVVAPSVPLDVVRKPGRHVAPAILTKLSEARTEDAWKELQRHYREGDLETKRQVLQRFAQTKDIQTLLHQVLGTVGEDLTPAPEDTMIHEASELLKARFLSNPEELDAARSQMLMEKHMRRKWVMADALLETGAALPDSDDARPRRLAIAADLVDVYFNTEDEFIRKSIIDRITDVAGPDIAQVLEQGPEVAVDSLTVVKNEKREMEAALKRIQEEKGQVQ